jgi:hypothetical protein
MFASDKFTPVFGGKLTVAPREDFFIFEIAAWRNSIQGQLEP